MVATLAIWCCEPSKDKAPKKTAPQQTASTKPEAKPKARQKEKPLPTEPPAKAAKLVVLAGGDVMLGRGVGQRVIKDPKYNPLRHIAPLLKTADLRFVNLESQLSDQGGETLSPNNHLVFTGPPGGAETLQAANIDLVSLANNHAWDYGKKALFETLDHLDRVNIRYAGVSREMNQAYQPTIVKLQGHSIAVFAVTHIWNQGPINKHEGRLYVAWASFDLLQKALRKARKKHDLVLVSYHGGAEYVEVPMQWTRHFARAVMSTGVDAFIGHHPHVPLGVGWSQSRPVFYSLGNLVFEMHSHYPWTGTSFMARLTFEAGKQTKVEACPYYIFAAEPKLFSGRGQGARERHFRGHLKKLSLATGGSEVGEPKDFSCMELKPKARP